MLSKELDWVSDNGADPFTLILCFVMCNITCMTQQHGDRQRRSGMEVRYFMLATLARSAATCKICKGNVVRVAAVL